MFQRAFSVFLVTVLFFFFSDVNLSYAIDPPHMVFRIDDRSPSVIFFGGGFAPWGDDQDIIHHVTGHSIAQQTSAFVSTTASMDAVYRMARQQIANNPDETYWLYEIIPDINFYYVPNSLFDTAMSADNVVQHEQVMDLYYAYLWQDEWASLGAINTNHIYSARSIMQQANGDIVIGPRTFNSLFVAAPSQVNSGTLPSQDYTFLSAYYSDSEDALSPMSLAFLVESCNSSSSSGHMERSGDSSCSTYKHSVDDIMYKMNLWYEAL
ncbi:MULTISPECIES: hypothetical protein [unclassified Bartonella]|uniref:scabin-related ADP-ribosyltransferase n=1 Tax=unclassified Bartonella TaxID=2645622 RepID=UPI0035CFF557